MATAVKGLINSADMGKSFPPLVPYTACESALLSQDLKWLNQSNPNHTTYYLASYVQTDKFAQTGLISICIYITPTLSHQIAYN